MNPLHELRRKLFFWRFMFWTITVPCAVGLIVATSMLHDMQSRTRAAFQTLPIK